ncbi:MAG: glycosyltransferase family 1 protein, partial [Cyanobacteria bacterium J06632_19]
MGKLHQTQKPLRVILVAENVSRKMGGESGKNLYYYHLFKERGVDLQIVCHARVRDELRQELPEEQDFNRFH